MQFFFFYLIIVSLFSSFFIEGLSIRDSITKSATYNYRVTIPASPKDPSDAIISIETSHVVVDLEGGCLGQEVGNTVTGLNGIVVQPNLTDIEIKNGNITGLTGHGVIVSDGCSNIRIKNIDISGCQEGGILVDGTSTGVAGVLINAAAILTCTGFDGHPAFGLKIVKTREFSISNCYTLYNDAALTSSGYGIEIIGCTLGKIINCSSNGNGGYNFGAGLSIVSSTSCLIEHCIFTNNGARSSDNNSLGTGFYADQCFKLTCNNCRSDVNFNLQNKAAGFFSTNGTGNIFQNCEAEGNKGATAACGFELQDASKSEIYKSQSMLNATTSAGTAYGILLSGSCDNCNVFKNEVNNNKGVSASRGIVDELNPSTSSVIANYCFNNGTNYEISYPKGITLPILQADLSNNLIGLPMGAGGLLDNIDINP